MAMAVAFVRAVKAGLLEVHVASAAAGGEAEMARLDDPGMHRSDRNLMHTVTFERDGGCIRIW